MKPITELSAEQCRALKGLAFDVDDTITYQGHLYPEAYRGLWQLNEAGVTLICATGRPAGWTEVFAWQWPIAGAVAENGSCWFARKDDSVHFGLVGPEMTEAQRHALDDACRSALAAFSWLLPTRDQHLRAIDRTFDIGEYAHLSDEQKSELRTWFESRGWVVVMSSIHCHVSVRPFTKAEGIQHLAAGMLNTDADTLKTQWAFIGDSTNDESAFAFFDYSVGVQNVTHSLSRLNAHPKYITEASSGLGFSEFAEHILRHR